VAFTKTAATCLKNFTSVPWQHYNAAIGTENTRIRNTIRNNFDDELNRTFILWFMILLKTP
jgi:hypothetical protein